VKGELAVFRGPPRARTTAGLSYDAVAFLFEEESGFLPSFPIRDSRRKLLEHVAPERAREPTPMNDATMRRATTPAVLLGVSVGCLVTRAAIGPLPEAMRADLALVIGAGAAWWLACESSWSGAPTLRWLWFGWLAALGFAGALVKLVPCVALPWIARGGDVAAGSGRWRPDRRTCVGVVGVLVLALPFFGCSARERWLARRGA
jgi:hypothetical protein